MEAKIKEPVKLKRRPLTNGNESLYLDIYVNGKRSYEFLKLYLRPELTRADKAANAQTLALANSVKAQRIVEIQTGRFGLTPKVGKAVKFFEYAERLMKLKEGTTRNSWYNTICHLRIYEKRDNLTFAQIDRQWVEGFRDYLDGANQWATDPRNRHFDPKPLSESTKALYFQKLGAILNRAIKDEIITSNPMNNVERFKEEPAERTYLTLDEVKLLARTPCYNEAIKRAFLFSCLTGLRWSDVSQLKWGDVSVMSGHHRLTFSQQKTGGLLYLDISDQAYALMGDPGSADKLVFDGLFTVQQARAHIAAWVLSTGINKHITFHSARHTFAVMMLDLGVDIYTLSKLLGHKSIETTEIYAKILDKNRQAAVARIPSIL